MSKKISREEVAKHNKENDRWVIISDKVYNVSAWQFEHPGGQDPIIETSGRDGTDEFEVVGHSEPAKKEMQKLYVGDLDTTETVRRSNTSAPTTSIFTKPLTETKSFQENGPNYDLFLMIICGIAFFYALYSHLFG